jgi:hypothetical protein
MFPLQSLMPHIDPAPARELSVAPRTEADSVATFASTTQQEWFLNQMDSLAIACCWAP